MQARIPPMRISHTIAIDAPIEAVWARTLDVESWPAHTPTMSAVQRLDSGALEVGSRARIEQPGQPARVWTVKELHAPNRFVWSTRLLGMEMVASHELASEGSGTSNALIVELRGGLAPVLGWMLRGPIHRAIAAENEGLRGVLAGS